MFGMLLKSKFPKIKVIKQLQIINNIDPNEEIKLYNSKFEITNS